MYNTIKEFQTSILGFFTVGISMADVNATFTTVLLGLTIIYTTMKIVKFIKEFKQKPKRNTKLDHNFYNDDSQAENGDTDRQD
jgi:hypothetical protein